MDFANELCLEKVDLGELYHVTIGAAEVHFVMVSADFEKYTGRNYLIPQMETKRKHIKPWRKHNVQHMFPSVDT